MATFTDANSGNDYQYYGCNMNKAEQVATRFTFPAIPNGGYGLVHTIGLRVGGALGENGRVRLAMWDSNGGGTAAASSELTVGGTSPSSSHTLKYQNISKSVYSPSGAQNMYLIGFWRADSNCSYTTNFSFYNGSSRAIYFDNSAASPGTFGFSQTFDSSATLLFEIEYYYCPPAPSVASVSAGDGSATIDWSAVSHTAADGGVDGYAIYTYTSGGTYLKVNTTTATSYTVTGLTNGSSYKFIVDAYNSVGHGPNNGYTSSVTPYGVPGTPTNLVGTKGNGQVSLSWTAPANNGSSITDYIVQYSTDNSTWTTFSDGVSTSTSANVTGLTNGTLYYFKVAAKNAAGTGSYTNSSSLTPSTIPNSPSGLSLNPSTTSITASWTAPSSGGSVITDYIIQYKKSVDSTWTTFADGTSTNTTTTITGLLETTAYNIQVAAVNANGTGTYVSGSTTTLTGTQPPSPPRNLTIGTTTTTQIPLSWTSPATLNGTGITYRVFRDSTQVATGLTTTTYTDTPGDTSIHTYTIYAKNIENANYSGSSNSVSAKVLVAPSSAPTSFTATKLNYTTIQFSYSTSLISEPVESINIQYKKTTDSSWSNSTLDYLFITDATAIYEYKIAAVNAAGTGPYSSIVSTAADTIPDAPTLNGISFRDVITGAKLSVTPPVRDVGSSPIVSYKISKNSGVSYDDLVFGTGAITYLISSINLNSSTNELIITTSIDHSYEIGDKIQLSGFSTLFASIVGGTYGLAILNNARNGIEYYTITAKTSNTITIDFNVSTNGMNSGTYSASTYFLAYVISYIKKDFDNQYYTDIINGNTYGYRIKAYSFAGLSSQSNLIGIRTETAGLMPVYNSSLDMTADIPKKFNGSAWSNTNGVKYFDGTSWLYTKYPQTVIFGGSAPDISSELITSEIDSGGPLTNYQDSDTIDFGGVI